MAEVLSEDDVHDSGSGILYGRRVGGCRKMGEQCLAAVCCKGQLAEHLLDEEGG